MRNSNLLKWAHANNKSSGKNGTKNWIHTPEALQKGHIVYLVKFLGSTEVDEPKGIEVVKEGIRKLTFNQQLKKSEGNKIPKVELTISIDGVAIQEPKTKKIINQFPLHRISYCADDKGEKKFFSFIAKEQDAESHICFVFVSDKLAEEITLTIGQAFDLAYRRFLETSGKELETHRHVMMLQQNLKRLEYENNVLRQRLSDLSKISAKRVIEDWLSKQGLPDLLSVQDESSVSNKTSEKPSESTTTDFFSDSNSSASTPSNTFPQFGNGSAAPPVPPRAFESASKTYSDDLGLLSQPSVGTKLEGLLLDDLEDDFNPRAYETSSNSTSNCNAFFNGHQLNQTNQTNQLPAISKGSITPRPRPQPSNGNGTNHDLFQLNSSINHNNSKNNHATDLFGMEDFNNASAKDSHPLESSIGFWDKRLLEMKDGFSRGLSFGNEDFSIESLDPLRN